MNKWLRLRDISPTYVWVLESKQKKPNNTERPPHGLHLHCGVHVPERFSEEFIISIASFVPGYTNSKTVQFAEDQRTGQKYRYNENQRLGTFYYLLKGADREIEFNIGGGRENFARVLDIRDRTSKSDFPAPAPYGIVHGKRHGVSHSLGRVKRAAAGWDEVTNPYELAKLLQRAPHRTGLSPRGTARDLQYRAAA